MFDNLLLFLKIILFLKFLNNNIICIELYEEYDVRDHYKCDSFNDFRDQKDCGGSWAFSIAEVVSDRICIDSGGNNQTIISEMELLTCLSSYNNSTEKGCDGASRASGFHYWITKGLPTKICKPFLFENGENPINDLNKLECKKKCNDGSKNMGKDRGSFYKQIYNEENIMEEIQTNGPITAGFDYYSDFTDFWINSSQSIYEHKYGDKESYHDIKIIGWGNDIINKKKVKYWLCVNSWGTDDKQIFKFIRGIDNCGIESSIITGYKTSKIINTNNEEPIIALENEFYSLKNLKDDF